MRLLVAVGFALALDGAAIAEEPGAGAPAAGAHGEGHGEGGAAHEAGPEEACTATSSDEACAEHWEHAINWWSFDYKPPYADPAHRHMPGPFAFALLNFGIFAAIMSRLAGKPLAEFVRARHTAIKQGLDEAAKAKREAEAKLREYQLRIEGIDRELDALMAELRRHAESEKQRILAAAAEQAARLRADAEDQIKTELDRTRRELKAEAVRAALAAAEKLLREHLAADDQRRLADQFVVDLEAAAAPHLRS